MNLFTWEKDHENDQPNGIVKALHSLRVHPCTPKPHESGVGGGGNKSTMHNDAGKWLENDHVQQHKKMTKKGDNNEVSLFTWKEGHKDDQHHMIKRWPCTIMQYRTIKGNDNEMMITCMDTPLSNTLLFLLWNSSMWLLLCNE
jgi:hypothetical protein